MLRDVRNALRTAFRTAVVAPAVIGGVLVSGIIRFPDATLGGRVVAIAALLVAFGAVGRLIVCIRRTERLLDEIQAAADEKARRLTHDEGTGALLRRFFLEACEQQLEKTAGEPTAYLALDLDFLKQLNDSLGHEAGDAALRHLVGVIRLKHPGSLVGRLGGDEFAFLVPCEDEAGAEAIATALLTELVKPFTFGGRALSLSATIGITLLPRHTRFMSEAVQFSDLALYEGKKLGRNRSTMFNRRMLGDFRHDRLIEREIHVGLERSEFTLTYQPLIDAAGRTVALRAAVQWQSGWLGEVSSSVFLKVAEASTLIDRLGEWTMRQACRDALQSGPADVCVPMSSCQLKRDDVLRMVAAVVAETGIEPRRVIVEVSGPDVWSGSVDAQRRMAALADLGVRLSLDNFWPIFADDDGSRRFPADMVRIGPRYIEKLGLNETENVIVSAVAMLAGTLGLQIVAEGVDTPEQMMLARTAGCQVFAGKVAAAMLETPQPGDGLKAEQAA